MTTQETMVIRQGDGTLICDKCLAQQYPDTPEPTYGWISGKCSFCSKTDAEIAEQSGFRLD